MDRRRIDAFLERFIDYASGATTIGLLAVADRSGLLSWLGEHETGTVAEMSDGAGLQERYVTEIMSGLAAAGVVEYSPQGEVFTLPPEHALFLASEMSPFFFGGWLDMIPSAMGKLDDIADAVENGGGVGFDEFDAGTLRGIDRGNAPSQRAFLLSRWVPAIPGLVERLERGIRVADAGCGAGTAAILLAEAYPKSEVYGFDVSAESLTLARSRSESIANLTFAERSVDTMPTDPPFDLVTTFDVIHDLADPLAGLVRIRESLAPGGRYLMMEPNVSSRLEENLDARGALLYGVSTLHCMTQSLAVGGAGLGAAWGREMAEDYAQRAGFSSFAPLEGITNRFSAFYVLTG